MTLPGSIKFSTWVAKILCSLEPCNHTFLKLFKRNFYTDLPLLIIALKFCLSSSLISEDAHRQLSLTAAFCYFYLIFSDYDSYLPVSFCASVEH